MSKYKDPKFKEGDIIYYENYSSSKTISRIDKITGHNHDGTKLWRKGSDIINAEEWFQTGSIKYNDAVKITDIEVAKLLYE